MTYSDNTNTHERLDANIMSLTSIMKSKASQTVARCSRDSALRIALVGRYNDESAKAHSGANDRRSEFNVCQTSGRVY